MAKLTKLANFRQNFVKIAKIVMQIFIEPAKSEEDFLYLSKITKNDSKILLSFTKDAKETKLHVYKKCT